MFSYGKNEKSMKNCAKTCTVKNIKKFNNLQK